MRSKDKRRDRGSKEPKPKHFIYNELKTSIPKYIDKMNAKKDDRPGAVAHACNNRTLGGQDGRIA